MGHPQSKIDSLVSRMDRLERQNRSLKLAIYGLTVCIVAGLLTAASINRRSFRNKMQPASGADGGRGRDTSVAASPRSRRRSLGKCSMRSWTFVVMLSLPALGGPANAINQG